MGSWLQTAPGRYLHQWEQQRLDDAVADAFGFHALQLGLPEVDALRANRMPHRWVLASGGLTAVDADDRTVPPGAARVALLSEFDALPFAADSIDLVVLPHVLEFAADPHQTLREVERVLRPQGRIVIVGLNPTSLWGLRQRLSPQRLGLVPPTGEGEGEGEGPRAAEFIGYWRLRDWLRLLGFAIEGGQFGCWRPPLRGEAWLARLQWMDRVGERWWPVLGGVYLLHAVKQVKGMRLVGLARTSRRAARATAATLAPREGAVVRQREREKT
ncbi:MAG: hypothetical protein AMXMBFR78_25350 [Rubrivivax sp.]